MCRLYLLLSKSEKKDNIIKLLKALRYNEKYKESLKQILWIRDDIALET
jgi:fibrillarin-like rRNA methylase